MTDAPPQLPRQPKLRSSCNDCGAAKLRCDRARPQCGRCLSLGLVCTYGVSRKMGKPPRERLRNPALPHVSRTPGEHGGSIDRDRPDDNSRSTGTSDSVASTTPLSPGPFPGVNNVPSVWGAMDGYPTSLMMGADTPDAWHNDLLGASLYDFASLEFGDNVVPTLASPQLEGSSTSPAQTKVSQTQVDESIYSDSTSMPSAGSKGHECSREAYDILANLSSLEIDKAQSISQSPLGSASTTASSTNRVPLDHVLSLNRDVSERLSRLLACPCARSPHLALLYASIICRVLTWYQQAAGSTQSASWSPAAITLDTASHNVFLAGSSPSSGFGSVGGSGMGSSTVASTFSTGGATNTPTSTQSNGLAVAPAKMAIGTFDVDDLRVQNALNIQLLSGEMRRVGRLIDQFASNSGAQSPTDEYIFGPIDGLYQSLSSWLRGGHSRIVNMMKSKLRELNT